MIQGYATYAPSRPLGSGLATGLRSRLGASARWGAIALVSVAAPILTIAAALSTPVATVAPTAVEPPPAIEVAFVAPVASEAPVAETPAEVPADASSFFAPHPAFDMSQVDLYFDPECICLGWY